jgi:hypothetical protein
MRRCGDAAMRRCGGMVNGSLVRLVDFWGRHLVGFYDLRIAFGGPEPVLLPYRRKAKNFLQKIAKVTKGFRLAVLIGFREARERWKEGLSRTRTKDEDDLVAAASRCDLLCES